MFEKYIHQIRYNFPNRKEERVSDLVLPNNECISLCNNLLLNNNVKTLRLEKQNIGPEGARALALMLEKNTTIQDLFLCENAIEDEGACYLARAFTRNKSLRVIYLRFNRIKSAGMKAIFEALKINTSITVLNLQGNVMDDEAGLAFSEAIVVNKTLQRISIPCSSNLVSSPERICLAMLYHNTTILDIVLDNVESVGSARFADLINAKKKAKLNYLDFALNSLCHNSPDLTTINTAHVDLRLYPYSIHRLAHALMNNTQVKGFVLVDNFLTAAECELLCEGLAINTSVVDVCLSVEVIDEETTHHITHLLQYNKHIKTFTLTARKTLSGGVAGLAEALRKSHIKYFRFYANALHDFAPIAPADAKKLSEAIHSAESLEDVDFYDFLNQEGEHGVLKEMLDSVRAHKRRNTIARIENNDSTLVDLKAVTLVPTEEDMMKLAVALKKNTCLRRLEYVDGKDLCRKLFTHTLSTFSLHNVKISDNFAKTLASSLQSGCNLLEVLLDDAIKDDVRFHGMYEALLRNRYSTVVKRTQANAPDLRELVLDKVPDAHIMGFLAALCTNTQLVELSIRDTVFTPEAAALLARAVRDNASIMELELLGCTFEENAAALQAFCAALESNRSIHVLRLTRIPVGPCAEHFAQALRRNNVLKSLRLAGAEIRNDGFIAISEALRENRTLEELNMRVNLFDCTAVDHLLTVLEKNTTLVYLSLGGNNLQDDVAHSFARFLLNNFSLKGLDLTATRITDEGALDLLKSLKTNVALEVLHLERGQVSEKVAPKILRLLAVNTTLQLLNVYNFHSAQTTEYQAHLNSMMDKPSRVARLALCQWSIMTHKQLIPLPISLHSRRAVMLILCCFERLARSRVFCLPIELQIMVLEALNLLDLHRIYERPDKSRALADQ